jgi:hypothetical protein
MADIDVEKLRSFLSNPDNMVQTDAGADAGAGSDAGAAGSGEQGAAEQQTVIQPQVGDQLDKDANAFAQMRVQNKLMSDMLAKVAQANGIQFTSQDDLLQKLNDDVLTKQAQAQGVDPELLKRLDTLERSNQAYVQKQAETRLVNDFASLQQEFGLSGDELQAFARELDNSGVPVESINVRNEYMSRHLDSIIQARTDAAVQAALNRDAKADAQSTKPNGSGTTVGSQTLQSTEIKSVSDLRSVLAKIDK